MSNQFAPGEPLTYDRLNELIRDVNTLKTNLNNITNTNENYPLIDVVLFTNTKDGRSDLGRKNKVQIFAGIETINVNTNTQIEGTIDFKDGFGFNSIPIVICSIEVNNFNNVKSSVQTSKVDKTSFKYQITLSNIPQTLELIKLHYIAIGRDAT